MRFQKQVRTGQPSARLLSAAALWLGLTGGSSAAVAQPVGEAPGDQSAAAVGASWVAVRYIVQVGADPGLGLAFLPEPSYLETVATNVGFYPVPEAVVLLEAVGADGDLARATGGSRVRPKPDMAVTPAVQARAILAEVAAASALSHSATDPATEFQAALTLAAAAAKADFAVARMKSEEGWFHPVRISGGSVLRDGSAAPILDQLLMVEALARLSFALGPDNGFAPWFLQPATALLERLDEGQVTSIDQRAQTIIAAAALRQTTGNDLAGTDLASRFRADLRPSVLNRPTDRMWALRAIALSATDAESVKPTHTLGSLVLTDVRAWLEGEDPAPLTTFDVSLAVAALNEWWLVADQEDRLAIDLQLTRLLEEVIGASGMIRSSLRPYSWVEGSEEEQLPPPTWVDGHNPPVDAPPMIADSVERRESGWLGGDGFDPVSAYALSAALVRWEPSPLVAPAASNGGPERTIEVEASDFSFSPARLEIDAGSTVTIRLINRGVVPHNFAIPALGVLVEAGPAGNATTVLDVPADLATYDFLCSLPGHYESGMQGTLVIAGGHASLSPATTSGGAGTANSATDPPASPQASEVVPPASDLGAASSSGPEEWVPSPEMLAVSGLIAASLIGWRGRRSGRSRKVSDTR